MANVTLMGASYSDVPAVELPKTGGGICTFHEFGYDWRGENAELVQRLGAQEIALEDTGFATWTPSTALQKSTG